MVRLVSGGEKLFVLFGILVHQSLEFLALPPEREILGYEHLTQMVPDINVV